VKSALESYWSFVPRVRYSETSGDGVPVRVVSNRETWKEGDLVFSGKRELRGRCGLPG
jgi:hypothetical protein